MINIKQKQAFKIIHILLWILIFISISIDNYADGLRGWRFFFEYFDGPMLPFLLSFYFNYIYLVPKFFFKKRFKLFLYYSLLAFSFFQLLSFTIEIYFDNYIELNDIYTHEDENSFQRIFFHLFLYVLQTGLSIAIRSTEKFLNDEIKHKELEKLQIKTELELIKNRLSPHFFFNTLNNIHTLIDIDKEMAKNSIFELSNMMRYVLYESKTKVVNIKKEIKFIENYIELMKIRVDESIKISFNHNINKFNFNIPPLIFVNFIENSFKHGVSYDAKSFIKIDLTIKDSILNFKIINSNHKKYSNLHKEGGIGLKDIKKRLNIILEDQYNLKILEKDNIFGVTLELDVKKF